jgi:hypothetical protein
MNLTAIATGWYRYVTGSPLVRQRMKQRLQICEQCEHKQQVDAITGVVLDIAVPNSPGNLFRCGLCKCPLGPLSTLTEPGCKAGKWNNT